MVKAIKAKKSEYVGTDVVEEDDEEFNGKMIRLKFFK